MLPPSPTVEHVVLPAVRDVAGFKVLRALPSVQRRSVGPFVFLDHFGPFVFGPHAAPDVDAHPHIGLSTLTYLMVGEMVHRDSIGSIETIRAGDVNWMTAGKGIAHAERAPPAIQEQGGTMFGQQIWVALPKGLEDMPPAFSHHDKKDLPQLAAEGVSLTVVAGEAFGWRSPVSVYSDLMYVNALFSAGGRLQVPPEHIERAIFVVAGQVEVEGQAGTFEPAQLVVFKPGAQIVLRAPQGARVMLLGGEPFPEPRHLYWNFVSSSKERIEQAKADWREGRFARIPGETASIPLPPDPPGWRYPGERTGR